MSPGSQLTLCECMEASGSPNGLSCDKDGWFIIGFQHQGTWGGDSGGLLPLSRAICCRPCVPSSIDHPIKMKLRETHDLSAAQHHHHRKLLEPAAIELGTHSAPPSFPSPSPPEDDDDPTNKSKAVAVVSIGCHPSSGRDSNQLSCEAKGSSFVSGFTESQRVASYYYDVYYPSGKVECCTPVVLLTTGEMWEVTRCGCGRGGPDSRDCGFDPTSSSVSVSEGSNSLNFNQGQGDGTSSSSGNGTSSLLGGEVMNLGRLLVGASTWRQDAVGGFIPIAPLDCCGLCLGDQVR